MVIASKHVNCQHTLSGSSRRDSIILRHDSCEGNFRWIHHSRASERHQTHLSTHRINGAGWSTLLFPVRHVISSAILGYLELCICIARMFGVFGRQ